MELPGGVTVTVHDMPAKVSSPSLKDQAPMELPDIYLPGEPIGEPAMPTVNIDTTLAERGNRYGSFKDHAAITQEIKRAMKRSRNWDGLADDQRESLEIIANKIGRILNGDPNYHDSWYDIVGYAKLVADGLLGEDK